MWVIPPDDRIAVVRPRTALFIGMPGVNPALSRRVNGAMLLWKVMCALAFLVVTECVRMQVMREFSAVEEVHFDGVTHFTANDRPEYSQPQGLWFDRGEIFIGLLDEASLLPAGMGGIE